MTIDKDDDEITKMTGDSYLENAQLPALNFAGILTIIHGYIKFQM